MRKFTTLAKYCPLSVFLLSGLLVSAQNKNSNWELWSSVQADIEISKKWGVEVTQEARLSDNFQLFETTFSDAELSYELTKLVDLSASYRYKITNEFNSHRIQLGAAIKEEIIDRVDLEYKVRYQREFIPEPPSETVIRNRLKLDYNIRKWPLDPYLSSELFYQVTMLHRSNKLRIVGGVTWKINKDNNLKFSFGHQREFNVSKPKNRQIIMLGYSYEF